MTLQIQVHVAACSHESPQILQEPGVDMYRQPHAKLVHHATGVVKIGTIDCVASFPDFHW